MEYDIFSIRDVLVCFGPIVIEPNVATAVRHFRSLSTSRDVAFGDLELYRIGTYDSATGVIHGYANPELIVRGSDLLREEVLSDEVVQSAEHM